MTTTIRCPKTTDPEVVNEALKEEQLANARVTVKTPGTLQLQAAGSEFTYALAFVRGFVSALS